MKLFIEKGYLQTRMTDITREADVSVSTFQNIFRSKDGVLRDLAEAMFDNQYALAREVVGQDVSPSLVFAVETCVQLTLTELNENIREVYVETYSQAKAADFVYQRTAYVLHDLLGSYQPECTVSDFYEMEIGTAGIMRNYMARPCDAYFTLDRKLASYLKICLRAYHLPEEEIAAIQAEIRKIDIVGVSEKVMQELFKRLSVQFNFHLSEA